MIDPRCLERGPVTSRLKETPRNIPHGRGEALVRPACNPGINININNFDGHEADEIDEEENFLGVIEPFVKKIL